MNKNKSVQAYLPSHIVAWIDGEARRAKVTCNHWVATFLTDLFQGQEVREEARAQTLHIRRQQAFAMRSLDGLLEAHSDPTLRKRANEAFRNRVEREHLGINK